LTKSPLRSTQQPDIFGFSFQEDEQLSSLMSLTSFSNQEVFFISYLLLVISLTSFLLSASQNRTEYQMQAVMENGEPPKPVLNDVWSPSHFDLRNTVIERLNKMGGEQIPLELSEVYLPPLKADYSNTAFLSEIMATRSEGEQGRVMALYESKPEMVEKVIKDLQHDTPLLIKTLLNLANKR